jgi:outer membrane protein OmpA-like peptidoglycan-associated protein
MFFAVNQFNLEKDELEKAILKDGRSLEAVQKSALDVRIIGYTDCSGSNSYNRALSEKRAKAVAAHWKSLTGMDQIVVKAEGESGCDPTETSYNESLRRVEIEFDLEIAEKPNEKKLEGDFTSASTAKVGAILPITGLNFIAGRHIPLDASYDVLFDLVQIMKDNPGLVIEIQGHVCCGTNPTSDGKDEDTGEFKLSENRAKFVYDHLIKNGIAPERMSYKGFAETRPLPITLQDPGLESLNRRVEIMIVSK